MMARSVKEVEGPVAGDHIELLYGDEPVIFRGGVDHWPVVRCAHSGVAEVANYLLRHDGGELLDAMIARASERGRLFYKSNLEDFNFVRMKGYFTEAVKILRSEAAKRSPATFYIGSHEVPAYFPGMERDCSLPLPVEDVTPNIWIGNSTVVATHNDLAHNVACVVSGKRRFTLFPPDQEENLYIGRNPHTPGGRPVSLVDLTRPDLRAFPRFRQALDHARVATLAPGDALYMPKHWWHNVEAKGPFNVLINFWWNWPEAA